MGSLKEVASDIIRWQDLEPSWTVPDAKVAGHMRWLVSWVGGKPGTINCNQGVATISENTVVGLMSLGVGQRQKGLHYHTITEIYFIVKGEVESFDHTNKTHRAGYMDCIYIPKGVPHGVRNCGTEDVELIWIHDGVEKKGASTYFLDGVVPADYKSPGEVSLVRYKDLEPSYAAFGAKEPPHLRWAINWVAGGDGYENFSKGFAVTSDQVSVGLSVIGPGHKNVPHEHETAEVYVILKGKAMLNLGPGKNFEVDRLDGAYMPAGEIHSIRNHGHEPLYLMWVHERPQKIGSAKYH
ncbi:hypothetical protein MMC08_004062 [Hypocenomyce scalaris]|nr:hypothetical protein [Hypocenomyce scalaris]